MSDVDFPKIGSLDQLDKAATDAAVALTKASAFNAVCDKAIKTLKPALASLSEIRVAASKEVDQANNLMKDLEGSYANNASNNIRESCKEVDGRIAELKADLTRAEDALNQAKANVVATQTALDQSTAKFSQSQQDLLGLPKKIQDQQKALVTLENEIRDAHGKHQTVEVVVKLLDLRRQIDLLDLTRQADAGGNKVVDLPVNDPKVEAGMWQTLVDTAKDLLKQTNDLPDVQAKVAPLEQAYKEAKARYEDAQKTRLEDIKTKQRLTKDENPDGKPATTGQRVKAHA